MNAHSMAIVEVRCDAVQVGARHRKDLGNLEVLAANIATEGLLQPIGITEMNVLVFGERRLRAFQDVLRRETVPARVVHVRSITAGEYAENEIRKDFTPSERVAIGKTIEAEVGNRTGQRTDIELRKNTAEVEETGRHRLPEKCTPQVDPVGRTRDVAAKAAGVGNGTAHEQAKKAANQGAPEPVKYISQVDPGVKTRDIAAKAAGFGNTTTYEQAKRVVDQGAPELVEAMDSGDVSIHAASVIATQPGERQAEIVQTPRELRRQIVREIRKTIDLPTTTEARRLARETGNLVADRTGRYRSGASAEERAATKADLDAIWAVTRGVLAIADSQLDPAVLASRLEYWHCPDIRAKAPAALAWLTKFEKGVEDNDQIS